MNEATTIARAAPTIQAADTDVLFMPYRLGPYNLRHRIVKAPLTRAHASRALRHHVHYFHEDALT
ncbi:hypothetical protein [Bradyrhizobium viridifuturi]|uniref:hypothetical protein n=1 Tax=Bradyrhizobium viridifuturi TaxID=1654716 RepID=UPI000AF23F81|nr:hypothetical protein [Bradyrhizobium viridifuturi]